VDHLHTQADLDFGDTIAVRLDSPANVMLIDDASFAAYERREPFRYLGGWVSEPMITLWPPRPGHWHVVIDLGDREGRVSASVQIIRS
jgi:hypothetical protein